MACDGASEIRRLLAILPGKPAPYAGKIPDKRPAKDRYVRFDRATWVELQGFYRTVQRTQSGHAVR